MGNMVSYPKANESHINNQEALPMYVCDLPLSHTQHFTEITFLSCCNSKKFTQQQKQSFIAIHFLDNKVKLDMKAINGTQWTILFLTITYFTQVDKVIETQVFCSRTRNTMVAARLELTI